MDRHLTVLGALFIAYGILGFIAMVVVLMVFAIGGIGTMFTDIPALSFISPLFGVFIASIIGITELPALVAGYGLLKRHSWARIAGIVVAVINIFGFPLGTGLGIYALWVLLKPETVAILEGRPAPITH